MMFARNIALYTILALIGIGVTGCGDGGVDGPQPLPTSKELNLQLATDGLNFPVFMTVAPNDTNRLFVVQKNGLIRLFKVGTGTLTTFLDLSANGLNLI